MLFQRTTTLPLDLLFAGANQPYYRHPLRRPLHSPTYFYVLNDTPNDEHNTSSTTSHQSNNKKVVEKNTQSSSTKDSTAVTALNKESPVPSSIPTSNIDENEDNFTLTVDLPGVKEQDVQITVDTNEGVLRVVAGRRNPTTSNICYKYVKTFVVDQDPIDMNHIQATLVDGVLTLILLKKPEEKPIQIQVQACEVPTTKADDDNNEKYTTWCMDVPGLKCHDLHIKYHKGMILVEGENKTRQVHRLFELDDKHFHMNTLQAYLMDGVLTLTLEKRDEKEEKERKEHGIKTIPVNQNEKNTEGDNKEEEEDAKKEEEGITTSSEEKIVVETANEDDDDEEDDDDDNSHDKDWHSDDEKAE